MNKAKEEGLRNNRLVSGLGKISPFREETELPSEYVQNKGLIVHL